MTGYNIDRNNCAGEAEEMENNHKANNNQHYSLNLNVRGMAKSATIAWTIRNC